MGSDTGLSGLTIFAVLFNPIFLGLLCQIGVHICRLIWPFCGPDCLSGNIKQDLFSRHPVPLIHGHEKHRQHEDDHKQDRYGITERVTRKKIKRNADERGGSKAD